MELLVLHGYNQSVTPDAAHGSLLSAPFGKVHIINLHRISKPVGTHVECFTPRVKNIEDIFIGKIVAEMALDSRNLLSTTDKNFRTKLASEY